MNKAAIGIWDSGIGGLSVHAHIQALLPWERLIYGRYGLVSLRHQGCGNYQGKEYTHYCFLLDQGCKLIVVACNTATAAAIKTLRATFPQVPL